MIRLLVIAMVAACSSRPPDSVANRSTPPPPPKPMMIDSSPGPLAKSHEALDIPNGCNACHAGTTFAIDANLCLGCHEHAGVRARIAAGRGFHASTVVRGKPCELCHLDHKGRAFDLMGWKAMQGGVTGFDHALAGWKLEGKHARMPCGSCHTTTNKQGLRTFVGTPSACASCHAKDQPHGLDLERGECGRCHTQAGWKPVKPTLAFDHDSASDARVPLASVHARVPCARCHPDGVFVTNLAEPGACERCHAQRSPHGNRFDAFGKPPACSTCHRASWRASGFAHGQHTRFPSRSEHRMAGCRDCHRGSKPGDFERLTAAQATCGGCHRHPANTVHDGKYSDAQCQQCHVFPTVLGPPSRLTLIHGPNSPFPLVNGHMAVPCGDCHAKRNARGKAVFVDTKPECSGCHQDSHLGRRGAACLSCHVPGSWTARPKSRT